MNPFLPGASAEGTQSLPLRSRMIKKTSACPELTTVILEIEGSQAYRIYDSFGEEEIFPEENGDFLIRTAYSIDDWVYGVILSYCPYIKVHEPVWLREKLHHILQKSSEKI